MNIENQPKEQQLYPEVVTDISFTTNEFFSKYLEKYLYEKSLELQLQIKNQESQSISILCYYEHLMYITKIKKPQFNFHKIYKQEVKKISSLTQIAFSLEYDLDFYQFLSNIMIKQFSIFKSKEGFLFFHKMYASMEYEITFLNEIENYRNHKYKDLNKEDDEIQNKYLREYDDDPKKQQQLENEISQRKIYKNLKPKYSLNKPISSNIGLQQYKQINEQINSKNFQKIKKNDNEDDNQIEQQQLQKEQIENKNYNYNFNQMKDLCQKQNILQLQSGYQNNSLQKTYILVNQSSSSQQFDEQLEKQSQNNNINESKTNQNDNGISHTLEEKIMYVSNQLNKIIDQNQEKKKNDDKQILPGQQIDIFNNNFSNFQKISEPGSLLQSNERSEILENFVQEAYEFMNNIVEKNPIKNKFLIIAQIIEDNFLVNFDVIRDKTILNQNEKNYDFKLYQLTSIQKVYKEVSQGFHNNSINFSQSQSIIMNINQNEQTHNNNTNSNLSRLTSKSPQQSKQISFGNSSINQLKRQIPGRHLQGSFQISQIQKKNNQKNKLNTSSICSISFSKRNSSQSQIFSQKNNQSINFTSNNHHLNSQNLNNKHTNKFGNIQNNCKIENNFNSPEFQQELQDKLKKCQIYSNQQHEETSPKNSYSQINEKINQNKTTLKKVSKTYDIDNIPEQISFKNSNFSSINNSKNQNINLNLSAYNSKNNSKSEYNDIFKNNNNYNKNIDNDNNNNLNTRKTNKLEYLAKKNSDNNNNNKKFSQNNIFNKQYKQMNNNFNNNNINNAKISRESNKVQHNSINKSQLIHNNFLNNELVIPGTPNENSNQSQNLKIFEDNPISIFYLKTNSNSKMQEEQVRAE
ncbi:hypothetical protein PPERSA_12203 [Pseudocohnilembus persalinus]|uniref:Uncharacterized protein n=1 Tax=Pseudocohnilembus persalinus TaxID=266149 RepID=A0A0V0R8M6_PSEPJ|nr:hypothetical protein PPERSA_12203 [Pseudocohnilembus persalinus]|eukprot:KRX10852.1 hypothetical protein PPERSA_12203 [Pseudocohnilembus persalinus]